MKKNSCVLKLSHSFNYSDENNRWRRTVRKPVYPSFKIHCDMRGRVWTLEHLKSFIFLAIYIYIFYYSVTVVFHFNLFFVCVFSSLRSVGNLIRWMWYFIYLFLFLTYQRLFFSFSMKLLDFSSLSNPFFFFLSLSRKAFPPWKLSRLFHQYCFEKHNLDTSCLEILIFARPDLTSPSLSEIPVYLWGTEISCVFVPSSWLTWERSGGCTFP